MKIAYLTDQFLPASSADTEQFVNMIDALGKQADVDLISCVYRLRNEPNLDQIKTYYQVEGNFNLRFIKHAFPNIRGPEKASFAVQAALKLRSNREIDFVYTRNIPVVISILLFTRLPVLFEAFRPWPNRNFQARWFFKKMANHPRFLGIILHSEFAKKAYVNIGFPDKKLRVEHNAFRSDFFENIDLNKHALRKELSLPADATIISYTGRVNKEKGLDYILELAIHLPDIFFLIVGSEGHGYIEQKAASIENVKIVPWQDKASTARYIEASDILYIPTSVNAREKAMNTVLPLKTFIYKASGKAIFAPNIADIREVLTHKKTSYLVEPDNEEAAVKGMKELIDNQELRERIGAAAKKEMADLTWENRATNVLKFTEKRLEKIRRNS